MFRNPRENVSRLPNDQLKPFAGRCPSPSSAPDVSTSHSTKPMMPVETARPPQPPKLGIATQLSSPSAKGGKAKSKSNSSILSFFKKAEAVNEEAALFVQERSTSRQATHIEPTSVLSFSKTSPNSGGDRGHPKQEEADEETRFNESLNAVKRRKTAHEHSLTADETVVNGVTTSDDTESIPHQEDIESRQDPVDIANDFGSGKEGRGQAVAQSGPFVDESDSDTDDPKKLLGNDAQFEPMELSGDYVDKGGSRFVNNSESIKAAVYDGRDGLSEQSPAVPSLKREGTSFAEGDGFADFEGMEDFEDEFEEGEEFVERTYMREQRRLAAAAGVEGELDDDDFAETEVNAIADVSVEDQPKDPPDQYAPSCPVCGASLYGITDQDASIHVNNCLDGNPTALPTVTESNSKSGAETSQQPKRFVRPPKPGQQNPLTLGQNSSGSSAFSKLMSGHSEENAWSTAAASERESRGKPSFQRTCPFYKILPGFYTCVDAFRYGAVSGCNAYFLSHFHSDHYVGLTSTWSHGKIYCSHITANLVRQQLRVDPKWVVDLEWEQKLEVPGTEGVHVTMIPANHCPGSSVFLFEKEIDPPTTAPSTAKRRTQRVLHCGDFRTCPAHIAHPKLAPEVVDNITGKLKHQKIDVCYLDTTYLSPKYAFPSQEEVIEACADMCVSLSKQKADHNDNYEIMKRERAGSAMTKFVKKDSKNEIAVSDEVTEHDDQSKVVRSRGRLLVVVGTYSIGKERICLGIARALDSLIYAPASKQRICAALKDPELNRRLTKDPLAASVHMTPLFEIRAETLSEYLETYHGHFSRAVGFRPSGWNYRPPGSRSTEAPTVQQVLYSPGWKSTYSMKNLVPQRGSNNKAAVYGVPYSEHSSFRELSMFVCGLRIEKVIPTVNVGSAKSREKMRAWCERWAAEKRKNGLFRVKRQDEEHKSNGDAECGEFYPGKGTWELRTTL